LDDRITRTLSEQGVFGDESLLSSELVLEGGAIETDGKGTLLATRSSLLSNSRNPGLTQAELEHDLRRLLGLERFLWLDHGQISGDDTDGHIDNLARFCNSGCICHVTCEDPEHPDYEALKRMERQLKGFSGPNGDPYRLVSLPSPGPRFDEDGRRLPASYANFLIVDQAVLVPVYSDPADETACRRLRDLFPGRRVIPIDCSALIRQNGSLHCITMQLPARLKLRVPASGTY
jgi:agmatine/peptidylarginine deiminase